MTKKIDNALNARDAILDTAEALFAEQGFDAASIRDITAQAGVRLASVNYYFKSKEGLFFEVISRRASVLSEDRLTLLRQIDFKKLDVDDGLRQLSHAFIYPLLKRSTEGHSGWKHYCRLINATATLRMSRASTIMTKFDVPALEFINAIRTVMPNISERNSFYAFHFLLGSTISVFTESYRIDQLSKDKYKSSDLVPICDQLVRYVSAGLKVLDETSE